MNNKQTTITAEEFLDNEDYYKVNPNKYTQKAMIEFAKYHVKKALNNASEKAKIQTRVDWKQDGAYEYPIQIVDKSSILNAYPLKNIK